MTDADLQKRIRRLYAALEATEERKMNRLTADVRRTSASVVFRQDFSGGASQASIENDAISLICNISHLMDQLKRWVEKSRRNWVVDFVKNSRALCIIRDLCNRDKHGKPGQRHKKRPGMEPRLENVRRVMVLSTRPEPGSFVQLRLGRKGTPVVTGDGSAVAITTGDIVGRDDQLIGSLDEIAREAVQAWESAFVELGIPF